jgi:hypothetical protein
MGTAPLHLFPTPLLLASVIFHPEYDIASSVKEFLPGDYFQNADNNFLN